MTDQTFFYLIGVLSGALAGLMMAWHFCKQWQQAEARAASWEKQARQLATRFEPMPRMHIEQRDGLPILTPDGFEWADCEVEDEEIEQVWLPEDLEAA